MAIFTFVCIGVRADDQKAPLIQPKVESPKPKAESRRGKSESAQRLSIKKTVGPEQLVTYSGFLTDLSRTNRPGKLLNLRQPLDPIHDTENILLGTRTGRPAGFRLFSIDF